MEETKKPLKDRILRCEWARDVKDRSETVEYWGCLTRKMMLMLHPESFARLERLAERTGHKPRNLAKEAIDDFLDREEAALGDKNTIPFPKRF